MDKIRVSEGKVNTWMQTTLNVLPYFIIFLLVRNEQNNKQWVDWIMYSNSRINEKDLGEKRVNRQQQLTLEARLHVAVKV